MVSLARFPKQTFVGDDNDDINNWVTIYDPHVLSICAEENDSNDQELIGRIDTSILIDKTWQGGEIQLFDTSGKLSEWKIVLDFDIPNSSWLYIFNKLSHRNKKQIQYFSMTFTDNLACYSFMLYSFL